MNNLKLIKIILSVLIIQILWILVNPNTVYSQSEARYSASSINEQKLTLAHQNTLYYQGEDSSKIIYFPLVLNQQLPPREKISLSIFAASGSLESYEKNLDNNGIPILVNGFTNGNGYHPSYICRYTLYVAAAYQSNPNEENYRKIQNLMTWIIDNRVDRLNYITWEFYEDLPSFNLEAPWTSALTNAWCSGALLHGYKVTGNNELETLARAGLEYLFTPLSDGGGLFEFENGDIWFEESPNIETPSHILNGFIFAIDILDMFTSYYGYDRYQDYFDRAVSSLVNRIDQYDVGYGSIYDLYTRGNKLGSAYHYLHCVQLYYLYLRTGNPRLLDISKKWYALTYQHRYELLDIPISQNNLGVINDGVYWYNYKVVKFPAEFTFDLGQVYEMRAINFFLYRDNYPIESMTISYSTEDGTYLIIPPDNYTMLLTGTNNTNGHITNVYTLTFNESFDTHSLRIIFEQTLSNNAGVFREIGLLKNMDEEYQEDMIKLPKFEDIVYQRTQN